MSVVPPLDVDQGGPVWDDSATCPVCGGVCHHPMVGGGAMEWDEDTWECDDCDYQYPE